MHRPAIRRALTAILDARAAATPEQLPMLTFAADRVARRLWVEGPTEDTCDGEAYAGVIRQGNTWLRTHSDSPWRAAVMTAVSRTYETKWALNRSFTADPRQNARLVTPAEKSARLKAIELYEEVMRLAPGSRDAAYARRRNIQIRANMTTSQDVYSCVYP